MFAMHKVAGDGDLEDFGKTEEECPHRSFAHEIFGVGATGGWSELLERIGFSFPHACLPNLKDIIG